MNVGRWSRNARLPSVGTRDSDEQGGTEIKSTVRAGVGGHHGALFTNHGNCSPQPVRQSSSISHDFRRIRLSDQGHAAAGTTKLTLIVPQQTTVCCTPLYKRRLPLYSFCVSRLDRGMDMRRLTVYVFVVDRPGRLGARTRRTSIQRCANTLTAANSMPSASP